MLVTELDVINACLASMGEAPVNSADANNIFITSAKDALSRQSPVEQSFGWYFNSESIKISPNTDNEYYLPADTLGLATNVNPSWVSLRGRRLYDNRNGEYLKGTNQVKVALIRLIPLADCPFHAARMIRASTVRAFQQAYDGDAAKIRQAESEYAEARAALMIEHIRSVRANMITDGDTGVTVQQNRFHTGIDGRWS